MFTDQKKFFLRGWSISGLTEDALLVFLTEVLLGLNKKRILFLSNSDKTNKRLCKNSAWFGSGFVYYPEKNTLETVPGFSSQYNRHRSDAIIKIATQKTVFCLSTNIASKKADINRKTKPVKLEIKQKGVVDRDLLVKNLLDLGYNKVDTVFKSGDLAVRGDIVDVFPAYEKEPLRISLRFNNVENISFFNVDSQRTIKVVDSYLLWDVFGREVDVGRSLVEFIGWDTIISIIKKDDHFSLIQTKQRGLINVKTKTLPKKITNREVFFSFLKNHPTATFHLIYTNIKKGKLNLGQNVYSRPGKINHSFCVKDNQSFYIPFWGETNQGSPNKTNHNILLNIDLSVAKKGDLFVHVLHGVGVYDGLKTRGASGFEKEYIRILYADGGVLYVPLDKLDLIHKYKSLGGTPKINKLGKKEWGKSVSKTKKEIELVSNSLIEIHRSKNKPRGFVYKKTKDLELAIKKSFPYKETKDQKKAIKDVLRDLKNKKPMDRLICGDVGFGKTEVALRAIVRVVSSGKQVLFLCPTTVLSDQHYISSKERLSPLGIRVALLSRFQTRLKQGVVLTKLIKNKIDVVIGTHRLLSDDVVCPSLGLLIVDEEHRFGVKHKETIRAARSGVDLLSLSATPIPRTLQQSILGIRDISRIETPPITRKPIKTFVEFFSWSRSIEIIKQEVFRGGQVYFLHNDIQSIDYYTKKIQELIPEIVVRNIHGQQKNKDLEKTLLAFFGGSVSVLVCSTIIESGLDVANANCIIINNPQNLGLSQLYQIRGRVGRGSRQASCYLFVPPKTTLSEVAFRRLKTIERHTSLGSGYRIASNDLDIRGAGLVFGYKQSGVVSRVGVEYYNSLLKNAIKKKLKKPVENKNTNLFFWGKSLIPIHYISNSADRFSFYTKIHFAKKEDDFKNIREEMNDRYGQIPEETTSFIKLAELSLVYQASLVDSINIKENSLVFKIPGKLVPSADQFVSRILSYENEYVINKHFKKDVESVLVVFLTKKGYYWYDLLINCNSLFYKT